MKVHELTVAVAVEEMARCRLSSEELLSSCLDQVDERHLSVIA